MKNKNSNPKSVSDEGRYTVPFDIEYFHLKDAENSTDISGIPGLIRITLGDVVIGRPGGDDTQSVTENFEVDSLLHCAAEIYMGENSTLYLNSRDIFAIDFKKLKNTNLTEVSLSDSTYDNYLELNVDSIPRVNISTKNLVNKRLNCHEQIFKYPQQDRNDKELYNRIKKANKQ